MVPNQIAILLVISLFIITKQQNLDETLNCLDKYIESFRNQMNPKLYNIFSKAYPNTLKTTIQHYNLTEKHQATYIITGDIQAMWLRDSTNQFLPYLLLDCPNIQTLAKGLINTQAEFIMIDPYTNAFKAYENDIKRRPFYLNDKTQTLIFGIQVDLCRKKQFVTPAIWERKFQIDSLASFLRLLHEYHLKYPLHITLDIIKALKRICTVIQQQTQDTQYEKNMKKSFYTFYRDEKQLRLGHILQAAHTGMLKQGFRPSDDANELPYNIPGNAYLSTYLKLVGTKILSKIQKSSVFYREGRILGHKMNEMGQRIEKAIYKYGIVNLQNKEIFAYEVDGFGNFKTYDDANLPSLLSLPYLQFVSKDNHIYLNTRNHILSFENPFYFSSQNKEIKGIGSSHTSPRTIWPLALITQILTTSNQQEIKNCLHSLIVSARNDLLHESFAVDNPTSITREWFAWANSFFGQMIITLSKSNSGLLK